MFTLAFNVKRHTVKGTFTETMFRLMVNYIVV